MFKLITVMFPVDLLDELRDGYDDRRDGPQFYYLDRPFLFAIKALDATGTDDPSTPPLIDTSDFDYIASDISLVDYAQELVFLPDLTEILTKSWITPGAE